MFKNAIVLGFFLWLASAMIDNAYAQDAAARHANADLVIGFTTDGCVLTLGHTHCQHGAPLELCIEQGICGVVVVEERPQRTCREKLEFWGFSFKSFGNVPPAHNIQEDHGYEGRVHHGWEKKHKKKRK